MAKKSKVLERKVFQDKDADVENVGIMQGFIDILDLIKSYFKTVFLISHMDSLKDIVDTMINIEKVGDYARVNQ